MSIHNRNSQFVNSPVIEGDSATIIISGENSGIDSKIWEVLQDEFIAVSSKLPKSSDEYVASKKALSCTMNKDKSGLSHVLKKNWASFSSSLFSQVASGVLVELIKTFA